VDAGAFEERELWAKKAAPAGRGDRPDNSVVDEKTENKKSTKKQDPQRNWGELTSENLTE